MPLDQWFAFVHVLSEELNEFAILHTFIQKMPKKYIIFTFWVKNQEMLYTSLMKCNKHLPNRPQHVLIVLSLKNDKRRFWVDFFDRDCKSTFGTAHYAIAFSIHCIADRCRFSNVKRVDLCGRFETSSTHWKIIVVSVDFFSTRYGYAHHFQSWKSCQEVICERKTGC